METTSKTVVNLIFDKLSGFLKRHRYTLVAVYCESNKVKFVECRTSKYQKTFIISIPDRYNLSTPKDKSLQRLKIASTEEVPSPRQIQYLSDMKGALLDCDILSISSEMLCHYLSNGGAKCYMIQNEDAEVAEENKEDENEDEISALEKDTAELLEKIKPGTKLRTPKPKPPPEKIEEEKPEEVEDEDEDSPIELIFEDESGEPVDKVKTILNQESIEDDLAELQEKIDITEEEAFEDEENLSRYNALPPDLEDDEIVFGIVYVSISISEFFNSILSCEETVMKCYEQLDDNEMDIRKTHLKKIKTLCDQFSVHSEQKLYSLAEEEKGLKAQLVRLTVILAQIEALKNRIDKDPKKYDDTIKDVEKIYDQTRETIHELNVELLKLRDTANDLLGNYQASLVELMEL